MKVTTDGCLFGAWVADRVGSPSAGLPTAMLNSEVGSVLDVGTGTGLLSLMIAQQCNAAITAVEIDKESFEQASENISASPWANRIKVFHADIKEFELNKPYDVIISNPPFYENELKGVHKKKNLAHHNEGLILPELLISIKKNLRPGGAFFLLLPYKRNEEIRKLLIESELALRQLIFVRPSTQHDFFRVILEGKLYTDENTEIFIDEISIKNVSPAGIENQYSPAFINLLKNYYLHL